MTEHDETDQHDLDEGPGATDELATAHVIDVLRSGDVQIVGRMPWSSNATFLVELCDGDTTQRAIYKPLRGERPLWDFPPGIHRREVAAFHLSHALGWDLAPPTVERDDAPIGPGSMQAFVEHDPDRHYFVLVEEADDELRAQLQRLCVFDLVSNQADRKSGHCVVDRLGRLHALDNGLSFHAEAKLRTVIWDFAGEPIPSPVLNDVADFVDAELPPELCGLLTGSELDALVRRARSVVDAGVFPTDDTGRRWPWPLV